MADCATNYVLRWKSAALWLFSIGGTTWVYNRKVTMPRGHSKELTIPELERMLEQRRSTVAKLQKKRAVLQSKLDALDHQIAAVGGGSAAAGIAPSRTAGGRVRNTASLGESIAAVMDGKGPMTVGDILDGVLAGGYRSGSSNFRGIVNQTLIKDKRFQSAGRGSYVMK